MSMGRICFGYVGVRYNETPLSVREGVSFTDTKKIELMGKLQRDGAVQCMVLSTCNRSGIFYFCDREEYFGKIRAGFESMFSNLDLTPYLQERQGEDAMAYLFRVAAGLESLVLGEDQILGQVVEALEFSQTMGFAGKELNKVVRDAISCAKKIKTEFKISEKPLSVAYIGVQKLDECCEGGIQGKNVLVLGSGKTAMLALTYVREHGPARIYLCNRTFSRARELGGHFPDVTVEDYSRRYKVMAECDIIVSATASPHLVVTRERYVREVLCTPGAGAALDPAGPAAPVGDSRVRCFLDLATPRDVDGELAELPTVKILDMAFLEKITEENRSERKRLAEGSQPLVERAVRETAEWLYMSRMDGTIESLQKRCCGIVDDSCAYLNRKLELTGREQKIVRNVLNSSLQRLLKEPIRELKHLDTEEEQEAYKEMIQRLFQTGEQK